MCIPLMSEYECILCLRRSDKSYFCFVFFKNKIPGLVASPVLDDGRGPPYVILRGTSSD